MVYLIHSNSYDMNCFSFLSSNRESRTDVRLSLFYAYFFSSSTIW